MEQKTYISGMKTVLKVDHELETVKDVIGEILDKGKDYSASYYKNTSTNSFLFGWIKSFCIVIISVKLLPDPKDGTIINIEATKPEHGSATSHHIQDAFYDFLGLMKRTFPHEPSPALLWKKENDNSGGVWAFLFIILLAAFLSWFYFLGK
ncbi:MAG TPA: hypothetical protein PLL71_08740 [Agriterribacter sp.]|nr:hypothetical protein [Agriterribacter sp.]HRQ50546.1 hypothetical protein [Agriterribacter sp.]